MLTTSKYLAPISRFTNKTSVMPLRFSFFFFFFLVERKLSLTTKQPPKGLSMIVIHSANRIKTKEQSNIRWGLYKDNRILRQKGTIFSQCISTFVGFLIAVLNTNQSNFLQSFSTVSHKSIITIWVPNFLFQEINNQLHIQLNFHCWLQTLHFVPLINFGPPLH